jgi:hypothetical protein
MNVRRRLARGFLRVWTAWRRLGITDYYHQRLFDRLYYYVNHDALEACPLADVTVLHGETRQLEVSGCPEDFGGVCFFKAHGIPHSHIVRKGDNNGAPILGNHAAGTKPDTKDAARNPKGLGRIESPQVNRLAGLAAVCFSGGLAVL